MITEGQTLWIVNRNWRTDLPDLCTIKVLRSGLKAFSVKGGEATGWRRSFRHEHHPFYPTRIEAINAAIKGAERYLASLTESRKKQKAYLAALKGGILK